MTYLSVLEVCSRQGAVQIHVYLTLTYLHLLALMYEMTTMILISISLLANYWAWLENSSGSCKATQDAQAISARTRDNCMKNASVERRYTTIVRRVDFCTVAQQQIG